MHDLVIRRRKAFVVALVFAAVAAGCASTSPPLAPGNCVMPTEDQLAGLLDEYPLSVLADDIREDLRDSLRGATRVCLVADGEAVSCNAGGGPKPDVRRCCRFSTEPRATVFGVARRIGISRGGVQVVDLAVDPGLVNASIDRQCGVPLCDADRVTANASLQLAGQVSTKDGTVEFELPVTLDRRLSLRCER